MEYIKKYIADMGSIKQEIRILKYPNGKYYNHYGWNEKRGAGDSIAGEFETLEEAKRMLKKHRPTAEEVKEDRTEYYKSVMSAADFELWMKFQEKGKRLGEIINNPKMRGGFQKDATRGMQKLGNEKRRLLKKYNLI